MKNIILVTLLFLISLSVQANDTESYCAWLGNAAISIAQNRDNGIEEYDLIGKYLSENKSYGEQSIVIPLIDRVYGIEKYLSPDEVAFAENQRCVIAFDPKQTLERRLINELKSS